jgi:hypothetical protein
MLNDTLYDARSRSLYFELSRSSLIVRSHSTVSSVGNCYGKKIQLIYEEI